MKTLALAGWREAGGEITRLVVLLSCRGGKESGGVLDSFVLVFQSLVCGLDWLVLVFDSLLFLSWLWWVKFGCGFSAGEERRVLWFCNLAFCLWRIDGCNGVRFVFVFGMRLVGRLWVWILYRGGKETVRVLDPLVFVFQWFIFTDNDVRFAFVFVVFLMGKFWVSIPCRRRKESYGVYILAFCFVVYSRWY